MRGVRRAELKGRLASRRVTRIGGLLAYAWRAGKLLIVLLVLSLAFVWMWRAGAFGAVGRWGHERYVEMSADMGLVVQDVKIHGRHFLPLSELRRALDVELGMPLMAIELDVMQDRLRTLSWVKDARVRRALTGRVDIYIDERMPIAIWLDAPEAPAVVDGDGVVLTRDNLNAFLPILAIQGDEAAEHAANILRLLQAEPVVAVRVKQANYISKRRWDLVLENGTIVKLPQNDPGHALARLAKAAEEEGAMLDLGYVSIDLRHEGRIIVENKPGDARELLSKTGKAG